MEGHIKNVSEHDQKPWFVPYLSKNNYNIIIIIIQ